MNSESIVTQNYEQILIHIVRTLPRNRAEQLVDFARFLEGQLHKEVLVESQEIADVEADVEADNAEWDALLATNESQDLLEALANEALAEYRAGTAKTMTFKADGRLAPE